MAGGLIALLDDVAALAKLAAASLDDVGAAAARAGGKTAGVVIDDTAVTPGYVVGLAPERELPIIAKIAAGSLRNKLVLILPAALLLSAFAPWALPPILMAGGLYLCFEGAEKIIAALGGGHGGDPVATIDDPATLEKRQVSGAIRTDLILSAEIMVIALDELAGASIVTQAVVLVLVGVGVTAGVYGAVALIVKMDDVGLRLARGGGAAAGFGRTLAATMPMLLRTLSVVGTAAMLWVGGGILIHGSAKLGFAQPEHLLHGAGVAVGGGAAVTWAIEAVGAALLGILLGGTIAGLLHLVRPHRH